MEIKDQMNRTIRLASTPKRIVSLVPSLTELLSYFGLESEVVGITKFCIHPEEWFKTKPRVGGTKQVHSDKIHALHPDFIIANKEENTEEIIASLEADFPVYITDIYTLDDAYQAIIHLGQILGKEKEARALVKNTEQQFISYKKSEAYTCLKGKRFLYFIWHEPDFTAGKNTYIDSVFETLGMINACSEERYPEAEKATDADFIFLSSEPYPFKEKHLSYFQKKYPSAKVILVDGEIFSWYGSKMQEIVPYIEDQLEEWFDLK